MGTPITYEVNGVPINYLWRSFMLFPSFKLEIKKRKTLDPRLSWLYTHVIFLVVTIMVISSFTVFLSFLLWAVLFMKTSAATNW